MSEYAVIVVDMIVDFISGELSCERVRSIVPAVKKLCEKARNNNVPVFFVSDSHIKGEDRELELWGNHALAGTPGANIIPELDFSPETDINIPKRNYSGFFGTELNSLLKKSGVSTIIVCGVQTHICCLHTCADAFQYGYKVVLPEDTTEAFNYELKNGAIKYIKEMYGARICFSKNVITDFK